MLCKTTIVIFFLGDKRWRTVIRRCASVSETGATNVCNWGVDENNVFWEQCYCTSDNCNGASSLISFGILSLASFVINTMIL